MLNIYRTINNQIVKVPNLDGHNLWIDLVDPSESELREISRRYGADMDMLTAALDREERPRIEAENDQVLLVIGMPCLGPADSSVIYSTLPLGILITEEVIITVALEKSMLIEQLLKTKYVPTTQKRTRFVLQMLYSNAQIFQSFLKQIDNNSNEVQEHLHKSSKNKELLNLMNLEKSLVYFTVALRANGNVFDKLLRTYLRKVHDEQSQITVNVLKKYDEDEDLLEDVITENKQAIDMADIYTNILSGTMDTFASIISNNLNMVMKFLAIVTIVMAIPTILASFYGMNVPLPFQNAPFAYLGILGLSLVLMAVGVIFMTKKKMY